MTDHKQEAIKAIYGALSPQLEDGYRRKTAEHICNRIAPLMQENITWSVETGEHRRKITIKDGEKEVYSLSCPTRCREFPERIIREGATSLKDNVIVVYFNNLKDIERDINALVEEYLTDLKRLWEGQETGEKIYEWHRSHEMLKKEKKRTCPKCGLPNGGPMVKCPHCGRYDTIERRSGNERRMSSREWTWLMKRHHSWGVSPSAIDKKIYLTDGDWCVDRRILPDRRKC